eukprot:6183062-Pleurochrysis_carterae.AAC.2
MPRAVACAYPARANFAALLQPISRTSSRAVLHGKYCVLLCAYAQVLRQWKSTGALDVVSRAVQLRPPTLVFPVADIASLAPLAGTGDAGPMPLRDCILMKPRSTVADVCDACKRAYEMSPQHVAKNRAIAKMKPFFTSAN